MALTFSDFKGMRPLGQAVLVLVIAAGGLGVLWYTVLMSISQENAIKQTTLDALNQQIAVAAQRAEQLAQIRQEAGALQARLESLTDVLPLERETPEILEAVRLAAEAVAMDIVSIAPQATIEREVYSEWPWAFQVRSTYHNMALFLDRIRSIPRIVNVTSVALNAQGDGVATSVTANFTATTFVYRDDRQLLEGTN